MRKPLEGLFVVEMTSYWVRDDDGAVPARHGRACRAR